MMWLDEHHVFPQAWTFGLFHTYQSALSRPTFLNGEYSFVGWWYYFPLTMLYKASLTLIISIIAAALIGAAAWKRRGPISFDRAWLAMCLALPPLLYLAAAMKSNLNLGLRHVLPVYPFIFIGMGLAARYLHVRTPVMAKRAFAAVAVVMLAEALYAFPNFIAFFNVAYGGPRGGIHLLSDSNLDWGQDLKLLAEWRQKHPQGRLHLSYFGTADPWAYGIENYINFPGGYKFGPKYELSNEPGTLAVSATMLQGVYTPDSMRSIYQSLRYKLTPFEVLGGTIYLYHWPPAELPE
jgi:hypothetical protein